MTTFNEIWNRVRENQSKLRACSRHFFTEKKDDIKIGVRLTCTKCGGTMSLSDVGSYVRGYMAAGGAPADVWPAFSDALDRKEKKDGDHASTTRN